MEILAVSMHNTVFINGGFYNMVCVTAFMDDHLRQEVADVMGDCHPQLFVNEYARQYYERFGEEFSFSVPPPASP